MSPDDSRKNDRTSTNRIWAATAGAIRASEPVSPWPSLCTTTDAVPVSPCDAEAAMSSML